MPPRKAAREHLQIDGRSVPVSNLEKVLYPETQFTKAQAIDFYIRVSQWLLPHLHNRPVTLKRFPDGVSGQAFYEKDRPRFAPDWIRTFPVPRRAGGTDIQYILINDLATLVWCANAASLELHPFLHCVPAINQPTSVVFDLDPGEGAHILTCAEVAFLLKEVLLRLGLESYPKVSGSKGLQIYVPLNSGLTYAATQPFALALAQLLAKQHPKLIVSEMAKSERKKKVFIDWSQNVDYKTTVGVYSLRAKRSRPYVSMPVTWDELDRALKSRRTEGLYFEPEPGLERLADIGDLFAKVLALRQSLPDSVTNAAAPPPGPKPAPEELREYARKRNFSKTAEPAPSVPRASAQGSRKRFVIQKHAASHLHYDFRLEMHHVLKSWAVPKGVPYELNEKRLAMSTEDHPLEYLDFEGVIPKGQYGGGTVMVWDIGTYELIEGNYYKGNLHIHLEGKKVEGEWQLIKERSAPNKWFLIRIGRRMKPLAAKKADASALTGRSMEQIAEDKTAQWHSNRTTVPGVNLDDLPKSRMQFIEPMQCKLIADLPKSADWLYELKLDGYRALAIKDAGTVRLLSRRNNSLNQRFPAVAQALESVEDGIILDGEIVALDEDGRPSFNMLQHHRTSAKEIVYYVFDLLAYRTRDTRDLPLRQRRQLLEAVLADAPESLRLSAALKASAEDLIAAVREQGLEGIVAKRADTRYEAGERSGNWVKYKINRGQELVVGGYKSGGKHHFENLAVGYYERDRLVFIAKLKNGFTPGVKAEIFERMRGLETDVCPFANLPEPKNARRGEALTAEAMKKYRWLRPELIAQVEFTDWTDANHLRHSKFIALRDDKNPREVIHEIEAPVRA